MFQVVYPNHLGSVLGPILFLMYINDLPDYLKNKCKVSADDCKVFQIIRNSSCNDLQEDINTIVKWCNVKLSTSLKEKNVTIILEITTLLIIN